MSPSAHEFLLEAAPAAGAGYQLVLSSLSTGKILGEVFAPPLDLRRLEREFLRPLHLHVECDFDAVLLENLGRELAAFLLPPAILVPLRAALLRHPDPSAAIRLHLTTGDRALAELPWEYLFVDAAPPLQERSGFLSLNPRFHLIRRSVVPLAVEALPTETVRVLIAWADPASPAYPALASAPQEANGLRALLEASAECRHIKTRVLAHATPDGLEAELRDWRPHILHFIGHGDSVAGIGRLILEGEHARTESEVCAETLGKWLSYPAFRLLTLSACRTASLGSPLTEEGVPAVIAMQFPWRDKIAVMFFRTFYSALMALEPLEEALCQARQSLLRLAPDWGVPALFLAGNDSRLLDLRATTQTNLPYASNLHFVGREGAMRTMRDLLEAPGSRAVALVGVGGIGKTQLALEYAYRFLNDYPGGVFWLEAADSSALLAGYAGLSRFFHLPLEIDNLAARVRDRLQQSLLPVLLILNNLTGQTDLSLLPTVGACRMVMTTREGYLASPRFQKIDVAPLDPEAALQLLQARRPAVGAVEQEAARAIVARTGRLPLALALAAHHVQCHGSFAEYSERLAADPLDTLAQARNRFINTTGHDGSLFDTLNLSYQELSRHAAHLLQAASCFAAQGISRGLLEQASGLTEPFAFEEALGDLEAYCLITKDPEGLSGLHELVRDFALDRAGAKRVAHIERTAHLLTQRLRSANENMNWQLVRQEIDHCRAVAVLCERYGVRESLCDLLYEIGGYLFEHADLTTAGDCYAQCLQLARGQCGEFSEPPARLTMRVALTLLHQSHLTAALDTGRRALALAEALWDSNASELADYYNDMGYILKHCGELEAALTHYGRALFLCGRDNSVTHASVANNIGALHEAFGNLAAAQTHMQRALEIDQVLFGAKHPKTAIRLNNIGRVVLAQGDAAEALNLHIRALEINLATYEALHPDVASCYYYLGQAERALEQPAAAHNHYVQALEIYIHFYGAEHRKSRIVHDCLEQIE